MLGSCHFGGDPSLRAVVAEEACKTFKRGSPCDACVSRLQLLQSESIAVGLRKGDCGLASRAKFGGTLRLIALNESLRPPTH